jgi:cytidylate kinase
VEKNIMKISVAIDGPAGAGKSTIAKLVGKKFDLMYINTGAMYRAVALLAKRNNIDTTNVEKLISMIDDMDMRFENDDLILDNINIQNEITMPEISEIVSDYASIPEVRRKLVFLQRKMSEKYNVIMDGRDIGTVVLKNSRFKFFLTASAEERARRRYNELINRGLDVNYDKLLEDIIKRDHIDSTRAVDPLRKADDAIEIDSSNYNINEVTEIICNFIENDLQ